MQIKIKNSVYTLSYCELLGQTLYTLKVERINPKQEVIKPKFKIDFSTFEVNIYNLAKGRKMNVLQLLEKDKYVFSVFEDSKELYNWLLSAIDKKKNSVR